MMFAYRFYDESLEARARVLTGINLWRFSGKIEKTLQVFEINGWSVFRVLLSGILLCAFVAATAF
ncbi:hypothetical protein Q6A51_11330 [Pseudomonas sp. KFB-139]|uniref:Uncharacterized protein n=1 Tax=Pseudomonas serbiensis TaxID=3064350 RepID=A0ABT9CPF3_9PSED|nr:MULTISPECIES: hypothetical protein [Pseudomonas]MDO7927375.1 hypothetical protein [Pseudomonas sp. KFB-138]